MWNKLKALPVQITIAIIVVSSSYGLLFLLSFKPVPEGNRDLVNVLIGTVIGSTLTGVMGWLYTKNKAEKKEDES